MARFLTFNGKVVVEEEFGAVDQVLVRYHGDPPKKLTPIPAKIWHEKKRFEYFDSERISRQAAIRLYKATKVKNRN